LSYNNYWTSDTPIHAKPIILLLQAAGLAKVGFQVSGYLGF